MSFAFVFFPTLVSGVPPFLAKSGLFQKCPRTLDSGGLISVTAASRVVFLSRQSTSGFPESRAAHGKADEAGNWRRVASHSRTFCRPRRGPERCSQLCPGRHGARPRRSFRSPHAGRALRFSRRPPRLPRSGAPQWPEPSVGANFQVVSLLVSVQPIELRLLRRHQQFEHNRLWLLPCR